jgi:hypothetical protein
MGLPRRTRKTKTKPYYPEKYYKGLSRRKKTQRLREILRFGKKSWKDPKAYVGFQTDKGVKTRQSGYTAQWKAKFPEATSLAQKSEATGVPLRFIKESYNRGMAAWRTGHRPGATEQQWGYARVHSFLLCGKTHYSTDSDLVKESMSSTKAAKWWASQKC